MTRARAVKWTDEQIREAVEQSSSFAGVRRVLGAGEGGSAWRSMKRQVELLELDTSHFDPYASRRGRHLKSSDAMFAVTQAVPSMIPIRKRYINSREYVCDFCGLSSWRGQKLRLHMDHINGDRRDNTRENLRLLCPNCHDQTETWGRLKADANLCSCGALLSRGAKNCRECDAKRPERRATRIDWPPREVVLAMIEETNFLQTGKQLGVSDNAVRKFLNRTG